MTVQNASAEYAYGDATRMSRYLNFERPDRKKEMPAFTTRVRNVRLVVCTAFLTKKKIIIMQVRYTYNIPCVSGCRWTWTMCFLPLHDDDDDDDVPEKSEKCPVGRWLLVAIQLSAPLTWHFFSKTVTRVGKKCRVSWPRNTVSRYRDDVTLFPSSEMTFSFLFGGRWIKVKPPIPI